MKLLITGATGLIGRELTQKLIYEGFEVNYLTTRKSKINSLKGANGFFLEPQSN